MIRSMFITVASLIGLTGAAIAKTTATPPTPQEQRVDNRQAHQSDRIDQGVASGQLTHREHLRLERQQSKIGKLEGRVEADGTVTRREAIRVERAQDHSSRTIAHAKHDRQVRP